MCVAGVGQLTKSTTETLRANATRAFAIKVKGPTATISERLRVEASMKRKTTAFMAVQAGA